MTLRTQTGAASGILIITTLVKLRYGGEIGQLMQFLHVTHGYRSVEMPLMAAGPHPLVEVDQKFPIGKVVPKGTHVQTAGSVVLHQRIAQLKRQHAVQVEVNARAVGPRQD